MHKRSLASVASLETAALGNCSVGLVRPPNPVRALRDRVQENGSARRFAFRGAARFDVFWNSKRVQWFGPKSLTLGKDRTPELLVLASRATQQVELEKIPGQRVATKLLFSHTMVLIAKENLRLRSKHKDPLCAPLPVFLVPHTWTVSSFAAVRLRKMEESGAGLWLCRRELLTTSRSSAYNSTLARLGSLRMLYPWHHRRTPAFRSGSCETGLLPARIFSAVRSLNDRDLKMVYAGQMADMGQSDLALRQVKSLLKGTPADREVYVNAPMGGSRGGVWLAFSGITCRKSVYSECLTSKTRHRIALRLGD